MTEATPHKLRKKLGNTNRGNQGFCTTWYGTTEAGAGERWPRAVAMSWLTVRQGMIEEQLFVPEATLVAGLGALVNDWEHPSKFTFSADLSDKTCLDLDGNEYEWQQLAGLAETPLATVFGGTENPVLVLAVPPEVQQVVEEQLPVVDALDEPLESLPVAVAGVTLLQIKELLCSAYNGDLDSTLIQVRGSSGSSMFSFKLSAMEPSMELMASVSARLAKAPPMLRSPMPKAASELRLKLVIGVTPKAAPGPAAAAETEFATVTKAKVLLAMARAQCADDKHPKDMQKLLTIGDRAIVTNSQPPADGKKNGGTVRCYDSNVCTHGAPTATVDMLTAPPPLARSTVFAPASSCLAPRWMGSFATSACPSTASIGARTQTLHLRQRSCVPHSHGSGCQIKSMSST